MSTTLRHSRVIRISPSTACDAIDGQDVPLGSCSSIINMIPDPSTKNVWAAKPTAITINNFTPFISNAGTVSCMIVVGNYIYGLIPSSLNAGKEQPFCIDATNIFSTVNLVVNNITAANTPNVMTQPPPWLPTMEVVGTKIIVTHPGFDGVLGRIFGVFDISLGPQIPIWYATNLAATGGVLSGFVSAVGANYANGVQGYYNVALGGGTGANAHAVVFVHPTTGAIDNATVVTAGAGYTVGDVLTIPAISGFGAGGTFTVSSVQTTGAIAFTSPPQWVAQFYQRAYFGDNSKAVPAVVFTDILTLGCTNANQALTFGDTLPTVAAAGLGLNNQLGGIVQSLIVFKGINYIIQITGDAALSTLAVNTLNVATGTSSARGVVTTPKGLAFAAPDGLRLIDFNATVSDPIGFGGQGVTLPFTYGVMNFPHHTVLGCNRGVIRVSLEYQYPDDVSSTQSEFWYDLNLQSWSGPHTTAYAGYSNYSDGWVVWRAVSGQLTALLGVVSFPAINAGYNPTATCSITTCLVPSESPMAQVEVLEAIVYTTSPSQIANFTFSILGNDGITVLGSQVFSLDGSGEYGPRWIQFTSPIVITRFFVKVQCNTIGAGLRGWKVGDIYVRVRELGYVQQLQGH